MKKRPLLDTIKKPNDLKLIPEEKLDALAEEVRDELLTVVSENGGHLASNLGAVELTISLVRALDLEQDKIVWDTGHQAYVYKLLTGRRELFQSLRQDDGCCGFLHRSESPYDEFGAGHAGTAISAALGMAAARDRKKQNGHVAAIVGDGALGCGSSLEGINSIIEATNRFILVINDNKMSISPNVGAMSKYLNRIISGHQYNRFKQLMRAVVNRIPTVGNRLRRGIQRMEEAAKSMLVPGVLFEELGLRYIGPINGHDIRELLTTIEAVSKLRQPIVLHVLTEKGRGYDIAAGKPETYHGTGKFDVGTGKAISSGEKQRPSFSEAYGNIVYKKMEEDKDVVAVTAGMCSGTGLEKVREDYSDRLYDVGIAEEHAVLFAAGLASSGIKPITAIYATFMQRAVDYVFHDICLQNLPAIFCLDRSGIVADGPTHHGIHDIGFWRTVPGITVVQPADESEMSEMIDLLQKRSVPAVVRYPKGFCDPIKGHPAEPVQWGKSQLVRQGEDVSIWAVGRELETAVCVADLLHERGIEAQVVNVRFLIPFDEKKLGQTAKVMPIVTLENHSVEGGFAGIVNDALCNTDGVRVLNKGWPREIIPWGTEAGIRKKYRLDAEAIASDIASLIQAENLDEPKPVLSL